MIVLKDGQKLYLDNWSYNGALIMSELAVIVENHGGIVAPTNSAIIENRSINSAICKYESDFQRWTELDATRTTPLSDKAIQARKKYIAEYEMLKTINNDPVKVTHTSYIHFMLDDTIYYYQIDRNPFFEFHYTKTPVINGEYSKNAMSENDKKDWLYDCFLSWNCSKADIKEAANLIFNMLVNAKNSVIWRDSTRRRVSNTYNSGYHYETIYSNDRKGKIKEVFGELV